MEIYIMRHGETNWNHIGIVQGRSKNRLSKNGINQVEKQAENFKDFHFDFIISSPLMRTMQTSNIMNRYHNVKILKDDRIIEIDQGKFTGRKKNSLTPEENEIKKMRLHEYGMENYEEIHKRAEDFFIYLKQNFKNKSILVVTHRAIASSLYASINNFDKNKNYDMFENAEIQHCHID